jgi:DNA-binding beta-propeller fold protein YncE
MEIKYTASPAVRDVIASLGRTEDVRFSPGNNRLAVADFARNRIAVFDIDIIASADAKRGLEACARGVVPVSE